MTKRRASAGKGGRVSGAAAVSTLTSTQRRFLDAFYPGTASDEPFYLSGGTALGGFYLEHRYSDDLDFFTRVHDALAAGETRASRAAQAVGLTVNDVRRTDTFVRLGLSGDRVREHALAKVELIFDSPPYPAPPRRFGHVFVDDLLSIAVNKTAIMSRDEPKDYVDLYFIVHEAGYRLGDLVAQAKQKLVGLDEWTIAQKFLRVRRLPDLGRFERDYMLKPIDWRDMIRFYEEAAARIFELFPPPEEPK